jgi:probable F420-dependent oxidoreductase
MTTPDLGRFGAFHNHSVCTPALAAGLEDLGFGALWVGGSPGGDLALMEELLGATQRLVVGTSIVNIWRDDAGPIAAATQRILDRFPGRFVLGIGAGHPEGDPARYARPYDALVAYLDDLAAAGVDRDVTGLAALGPRVLELAASRTGIVMPYLVPVEHTRQAAAVVGDRALLAPEHTLVLDGDRERGRALARTFADFYLKLTNYVTNLRRFGFGDEDFANGGSDRLIDEIVAIGEPEAVASVMHAHAAAGADHVVLQLVVPEGGDRLAGYARLAPALFA